MSSSGEWLHSEREVKEAIQSGFSELYMTSHSYSALNVPAGSSWQACLSDEERDGIEGGVSDDEIKAGLWSLKAFNVQGPDGLHAGFFQRFWLVVGTLVVEEVRKIFTAMEIAEELYRTHITFIPKIPRSETLNNYRPISLCNTVYKIVSKILVARLRPLLGKLISPLQFAFIPSRRGTDNAIITQELIHTITRKKGRLEWGFIREMLIKINLPHNIIKLIMSYVSTVSTSIVVNGGASDLILPSRGLRQRDPISPYIFILCMDFLVQLIEEKCSTNKWKPVRANRSGVAFSHLFFANDLILFAKANPKNCAAIREVLDLFCSKSGQSVNGVKSRVYFSPNVDRDSREDFCATLGFQSTPNLGKYLGIPIKNPGSSSQDFNFVLERVKQKLAS